MSTASTFTQRTLAAAAAALIAALPAAAAPAQAPALAPGVQAAKDLTPVAKRYVVTNDTPVYKTPYYDPAATTGETIPRGQRLDTLGETTMGGFLLLGRGGQGVGYVPRSLVCPVEVCTNVTG